MQRLRFIWKLYLVFFILTSVTIGTLGYFFRQQAEPLAHQRMLSQLEGRTRIFHELAKFLLQSNWSRTQVQKYLEELSRTDPVRITLFDAEGGVIGDSQGAAAVKDVGVEIAEAKVKSVSTVSRPNTLTGAETAYLAMRVDIEGKLLGFVRGSIPLSSMERDLHMFRSSALNSALAASLASLLCGFLLARIVANPLKNLTIAADSIAGGDYSRRADVQTWDEFGTLARSFNQMAQEFERQLVASLERDRLFTLSRDMVCIAAFDGTFKHLNPSWPRTFGFTQTELLSKSMLELVIPEDQKSAIQSLAAIIETETSHQFEARCFTANKDIRWISWSITPFKEDQLLYAICRDITEKKRAEASLLERTEMATLGSSVGTALAESHEISISLQKCSEAFVQNLGAAFARIWVLNTVSNVLELQASAGIYTHLNGAHSRIAMGEFKIGRIGQNRKPLLTNNVLTDPEISDPDWARKEGMVAFAGYPLVVEDQLVGVVGLFARHSLSQWTFDAMGLVANQIAIGIDRKLAEQALQQAHNRLERRVAERTSELADTNKILRCEISEHQRTERALRQAEEKFRSIFENSVDGIFQISREGKMLSANSALARIFGYQTPEDLIQSVADISFYFVDPQRRAEFVRQMDEYGTVIAFESQIHRCAGTIIWITENARSIRDANGKLLHYEGTIEDITKRKEAEEQVREQAELLEKVQDAITVLDLNGKVVFWNRSASRLYGWSSAEARGEKLHTLLGYPEENKVASDAVRDHGEWFGELRERTRKGGEVTVESQWKLLRDPQGQPKSILVVNTDVTERKRMEAKFLRAQRMESIGTLAGGIAHDLNNVLTPILMSVQLLQSSSKDERSIKIMGMVEKSARRGAELVRQVLTFARGVEGDKTPLDPCTLIKEIVRIAEETFPNSIQIVNEVSAPGHLIVGDATQLHQVFMNLCLNARDAMPEGGTLKLSISLVSTDQANATDAEPGEYVVIHVADTGTGIPEAIQEKIFDPFFTTKEVGKGTGLGLSTALGIIKSHRGYMNLVSVPDKGTQFNVHLPLSVSARLTPAQEEPESLPQGRGETILVIDDETSICEIGRNTLEAHGYQVLTASDGAEGLAIYAENQEKISCVLTDMMMPFLDGIATIRALHKINPLVKIIASSGISNHRSEAENAGPGVLGFLPKPYTAEKLLRILDELIHHS